MELFKRHPQRPEGPGFTPPGCHLQWQLPWAKYSEPQDPNSSLFLLESFICFLSFENMLISCSDSPRLYPASLDASGNTSDVWKLPQYPSSECRQPSPSSQIQPPPYLSESKSLIGAWPHPFIYISSLATFPLKLQASTILPRLLPMGWEASNIYCVPACRKCLLSLP